MDSEDEETSNSSAIGSDELLADDDLRLPESANILVRLHAVRAWLRRRQEEAMLEVGEAALELQEISQEELQEKRPPRELQLQDARMRQKRTQRAEQALTEVHQRLSAYEEAQTLLEECIAHTNGERVLVEYYLVLDELVQKNTHMRTGPPYTLEQLERASWLSAIADVQRRIEHVGTPMEEE